MLYVLKLMIFIARSLVVKLTSALTSPDLYSLVNVPSILP